MFGRNDIHVDDIENGVSPENKCNHTVMHKLYQQIHTVNQIPSNIIIKF